MGDLDLDPDRVFIDIFRSHDLSGWAKALWFLFVLFIPLIGVLVYLIARGGKMHERAARQAQQQDRSSAATSRRPRGSPASTADQLAKLADLRDRGVITAEEFEREKAKVLARCSCFSSACVSGRYPAAGRCADGQSGPQPRRPHRGWRAGR